MGLGRRLIFIVFFLGAGCGPQGQHPASERPPSFLSAQKGLVRNFERADSDFDADTDGDGIPDRLDPDIDGDGIPNLADEYPYDPKLGAEDRDQDGIPDFVDLEVGGALKPGATFESARLQKEIFQARGVLVVSKAATGETMEGEFDTFSEKELTLLRDGLLFSPLGSFKKISDHLQVVIKRPPPPGMNGKSGNPREFGSYYRYWKIIELDTSLLADGARFEETWSHELFHALAEAYPKEYQEFMTLAGWSEEEIDGGTVYVFQSVRIPEYGLRFEMEKYLGVISGPEFPSEYSKMGPSEMFAECGGASLILLSGGQGAGYRLQEFFRTPLYQWFASWLKKGSS